MKTIWAVCYLALVLSVYLVLPTHTNAQFLPGTNEVTLRMSPKFPEPFEQVKVELNAYTIDTTGATIVWYINGIEISDNRNTRKITVTVGDLREKMTVSAKIIPASGVAITASKDIIPSRVDIALEANTLVPLHYKGRALPSNGSTIRAIALPATQHNPKELSYKWTVNDKTLYGGSLIGRQVAEFQAPKRQSVIVSVTVSDKTGKSIAQKTAKIYMGTPQLLFYEDNALRGLSKNTLGDPHALVGDEITVRAEPYYMSSDIFATNPLMEWEINDRSIDNPSDNPQTITLRKNNEGSGRFRVGFHIRNLAELLQGVEDEFVMTF